ncbi:unnamed protein product, partial [Allacma fusca]
SVPVTRGYEKKSIRFIITQDGRDTGHVLKRNKFQKYLGSPTGVKTGSS